MRTSIQAALSPNKKKRRFSDALIADERKQLEKFREIFREVMKVMNKNRNKCMNIEKLVCHQYLMEKDQNLSEEEVKIVLKKVKEFNISPLEVGHKFKVLALHPKVGTLHTGTILTSNIVSAHIQFDREDLGVCLIKDFNMISFNTVNNLNSSAQLKVNDIRDLHLNSHIKSLFNEQNFNMIVPIEDTEVGIVINGFRFEKATFSQWQCCLCFERGRQRCWMKFIG